MLLIMTCRCTFCSMVFIFFHCVYVYYGYNSVFFFFADTFSRFGGLQYGVQHFITSARKLQHRMIVQFFTKTEQLFLPLNW